MKVSTQPYKGARDFYPEDKRLQKWMFDTWRQVVETYGFEEMDAPILEPTDLYLMKGNEEIIKEQTYTFTDRGDRSVTIRAEMTPSVSRMVAGRRQELPYPLRWYSIPNLWRYERMQRGRLREFWQLNVEMFGVASEAAEFEMIQIVDDLFQAFKAKRSTYTIRLNSRILVNHMLVQECGLELSQTEAMIRLTDRLNKLTPEDFAQQVLAITQNQDKASKIIDMLGIKSLDNMPEEIQALPSVKALKSVMKQAKEHGITNVEFDTTLMRGFDYYTDIVFEVFDTGSENNRAMLGGGRYDGLVGQFGVEPVPTIGFAAGDVVFADFLHTYKLIPDLQNTAELLVIPVGEITSELMQAPLRELRDMGAKVAVDYTGRKTDKQYKSAVKSAVSYVLFIDQESLSDGRYVLKNIKTGKEEKHSLQRIVSIIKDSRKK